MLKVLIDHREDKKLKKELTKKGINLEITSLISADVILETNKETIGIEIKKQNDFLNSIMDKRLTSQLIKLKENFPSQILIIEGSQNIYEMRKFHPNSIRGMLSLIAVDLKIPIVHTRNQRDTAAFIETIFKRFTKPRSEFSLLKKKKPINKKELQEYIIETLPGVGPSLAKSLLKEFGSIKNIINSNKEDFKVIKNLGNKKAEKIHSILQEKYS